MRVLIVDDYAVVRRGMREILEDHYAGVAIGEHVLSLLES